MDMEHPHNTNNNTRRRSCFRGLTLTVISIFLIFMLIISIAWSVMHPHDPGFGVTSLSVSKFTVSDSQLRGKYEVDLTMTNPNKKIQVMLDHFKVWVLYGDVSLSEAEVQQQPVSLEKMSNKSVKVDLVVRNSPKWVHENLGKDWNKGVVNFNLKMFVRVRFSNGIWPSREKCLNVNCGDLDVGFFSPKDTGKLLGIGKGCYIP